MHKSNATAQRFNSQTEPASRTSGRMAGCTERRAFTVGQGVLNGSNTAAQLTRAASAHLTTRRLVMQRGRSDRGQRCAFPHKRARVTTVRSLSLSFILQPFHCAPPCCVLLSHLCVCLFCSCSWSRAARGPPAALRPKGCPSPFSFHSPFPFLFPFVMSKIALVALLALAVVATTVVAKDACNGKPYGTAGE